jgi:hypothetical protein
MLRKDMKAMASKVNPDKTAKNLQKRSSTQAKPEYCRVEITWTASATVKLLEP